MTRITCMNSHKSSDNDTSSPKNETPEEMADWPCTLVKHRTMHLMNDRRLGSVIFLKDNCSSSNGTVNYSHEVTNTSICEIPLSL